MGHIVIVRKATDVENSEEMAVVLPCHACDEVVIGEVL